MSWFTVLRLLLYRSVLELFSKSFKVFHCSVINVRCCYFQQLVYFIISSSRCQQLFDFFFVVVLSRQLWYLIMSVAFCQQLFESFYLIQSGEGGIWTLAPLLTTCTLSRGVPSASLGTSPNKQSMVTDSVDNGESGIRTHAPLRTNGFQDRLVMTTSISLQL